MNITLYNITQEQAYLNSLLEESGGELTPEIEEALAINEANFLIKGEAYVESVAKYKALEEAAKARKQYFDEVAKTAAKIQQRLKDRLLCALEDFGMAKAEMGLHTISTRKSQVCEIYDAELVPDRFTIIEKKVSKTAVKDALKAGEDVPGAVLINSKTLQIKAR